MIIHSITDQTRTTCFWSLSWSSVINYKMTSVLTFLSIWIWGWWPAWGALRALSKKSCKQCEEKIFQLQSMSTAIRCVDQSFSVKNFCVKMQHEKIVLTIQQNENPAQENWVQIFIYFACSMVLTPFDDTYNIFFNKSSCSVPATLGTESISPSFYIGAQPALSIKQIFRNNQQWQITGNLALTQF